MWLSTSFRPPQIVRLALAFWAAAAAYAIVYVRMYYAPGDWLAVAGAFLAAAAIVAAPVKPVVQVLLALLFGSALRLAGAQDLAGVALQADPKVYAELAENLLGGRGLVATVPGYGEVRALYPPVYSLLLATAGGSAVLLNLAVDISASAMMWVLSRGSTRAAAAYFLFPSILLSSLLPLKTGLAVALVLATMLLLRRPLLFGVAAGLLALTQPAWAPMPVLALAFTRPRPQSLLWAATGALAVLAPWWIRNAILFEHFVPLTTSWGVSFWFAVTGVYPAVGHLPLDEPGRTAMAASMAWESLEWPRYIERVFKNAALSFATDWDASSQLAWTQRPWAGATAYVTQLSWAVLIATAAAVRPRPDGKLIAFAAAFAITCALNIWFEFGTRHRAVAVPLLLLWIVSAQARGGNTSQALDGVKVRNRSGASPSR